MFQKVSEKIDAESFVDTFLESNESELVLVLNHAFYESDELDRLVKFLTGVADRRNLGLNIKIHQYVPDTNEYFVMIQMEKAYKNRKIIEEISERRKEALKRLADR